MRAKQDIPALTGLRGAAALWVAAYHLLLPAGFVTGAAAGVLGRGYLAVDLFFVLSGFVMALSYGDWFRARIGREAVGNFLLRRFARLYPLYGLILVFRFAYTLARYGTFDLPRPWIAAPLIDPALDMPANLLMVQAWGLSGSSIGTAWSISTEWGAYFVFPVLAMLMLWRGWRPALATLFCAGALLAGVVADDLAPGYHAGLLDAWNGLSAGPLMRCFAGFTIGMGVWRASQVPGVARLAGALPVVAGIIALLCILLGAGAPDLAIYPLFPAMVLSLACCRMRTPFSARPLVWLGEISYALYLLHIFLLHPLDVTRSGARLMLAPWLADILAPVLIFGGLLAASDLCFRHVEMPGRRLVLRLGSRLLQPRQAAAMDVRLTPNT
jgi:peptidoglycan/LPS O-acetylase OafA/YrhL